MNNFLFFTFMFFVPSYIQAAEIIYENTIYIDSHRGFLGRYEYKTRCIHDAEKIEYFSKQFQAPPVENTLNIVGIENPYTTGICETFGMSEHRICQNENKILYTSGIADCIGLSVWDSATKTAALKHVSKMELRDNSTLFKNYFLKPLLERVIEPSKAVVNVVSSYWSEDVLEVIGLIVEKGFFVSGISIPDAVIDSKDLQLNIYINKNTVQEAYWNRSFPRPVSSFYMDTETGRVGFDRS